jgi:protease I
LKLQGKQIGILMEADYYEPEIWYYQRRFPEEGAEVHLLTRLWGQPSLTFKGHEYHIPLECHESFEEMEDAELRRYAAIIVPAGMVADRLRYTEDIKKLPPAVEFLRRAFNERSIVKGIIRLPSSYAEEDSSSTITSLVTPRTWVLTMSIRMSW